MIYNRLARFGWREDLKLSRVQVSGRGVLPERRLYYYDTDDPEKPVWIVIASLAEGRKSTACQYVTPGGALIRLGEAGEEARFFVAGTPPVSFVDSPTPAPKAATGCDLKSDDLKWLSPKLIPGGEFRACALLPLAHNDEQSLVAAARSGPQDGGEQIVEIWLRDKAVGGTEGESILDYPIASISVKASSIDRIRFLAGDSEGGTAQGQLRIGFEVGNGERAGVSWTWGGEAVLERSCSLLRKLPDVEIRNLQKAIGNRHSAFFAQVSREKGGFITRNNNLEILCPKPVKEIAAADSEAVLRISGEKSAAAVLEQSHHSAAVLYRGDVATRSGSWSTKSRGSINAR